METVDAGAQSGLPALGCRVLAGCEHTREEALTVVCDGPGDIYDLMAWANRFLSGSKATRFSSVPS
jgi:hypothetical protein